MFEVEPISVNHRDVIHDVIYNFYGKRMATCSSDQTVKIWDEDSFGNWSLTSGWKAHSGSIWRMSWAHPEYGQVLATCSFDRTASVWEEVMGDKSVAAMPPVHRWIRRTTLVDSRTSVTDIEFAPTYLGLILATASSDGIIRIYEATDVMNLSQWSVQHEITTKFPLSCLSWNTSCYKLSSQLLAAGSDETATTSGKVFVFAYSDNARKYLKVETISEISCPVTDIAFAPNAGRTVHLLAVGGKDLYILTIRNIDLSGVTRTEIKTLTFSDHNCPVWRVCWNMLATLLITTGDDGIMRIWKMNYATHWKCAAVLKAEGLSVCQDPLYNPSYFSSMAATAKYFKKGAISNQNQIPWH